MGSKQIFLIVYLVKWEELQEVKIDRHGGEKGRAETDTGAAEHSGKWWDF